MAPSAPTTTQHPLAARIAPIITQADNLDFEDPTDYESVLETIVEELNNIAMELHDAANDILDETGHHTPQSTTLDEQGYALDEWVSTISHTNIPDLPDPADETRDCTACCGVDNGDDCIYCSGTGEIVPGSPTDQQMIEWKEQVERAMEVLEDTPF